MPREIEIKFQVKDLRRLARTLRTAGFRLVTPRMHEMNTLYDLPGEALRARKQLLRLRKYGSVWTLTHKSGGKKGRHSSRVELETRVADGKIMDAILRGLGYAPTFRYEKFRAEWTDGTGQVVVDETPIGNFCEIEGHSRWIDATAKARSECRQLHHEELRDSLCRLETGEAQDRERNDLHRRQTIIEPHRVPTLVASSATGWCADVFASYESRAVALLIFLP